MERRAQNSLRLHLNNLVHVPNGESSVNGINTRTELMAVHQYDPQEYGTGVWHRRMNQEDGSIIHVFRLEHLAFSGRVYVCENV